MQNISAENAVAAAAARIFFWIPIKTIKNVYLTAAFVAQVMCKYIY
jgi:hypothetical protein